MSTFAALEQRANAAVFARLSNAVALVGLVEVPCIFDAPYAAPFGESLDTTQPMCTVPSTAAPVQRGDTITIAAVRYLVERCEPDGTGATRLTLYAQD